MVTICGRSSAESGLRFVRQLLPVVVVAELPGATTLSATWSPEPGVEAQGRPRPFRLCRSRRRILKCAKVSLSICSLASGDGRWTPAELERSRHKLFEIAEVMVEYIANDGEIDTLSQPCTSTLRKNPAMLRSVSASGDAKRVVLPCNPNSSRLVCASPKLGDPTRYVMEHRRPHERRLAGAAPDESEPADVVRQEPLWLGKVMVVGQAGSIWASFFATRAPGRS